MTRHRVRTAVRCLRPSPRSQSARHGFGLCLCPRPSAVQPIAAPSTGLAPADFELSQRHCATCFLPAFEFFILLGRSSASRTLLWVGEAEPPRSLTVAPALGVSELGCGVSLLASIHFRLDASADGVVASGHFDGIPSVAAMGQDGEDRRERAIGRSQHLRLGELV